MDRREREELEGVIVTGITEGLRALLSPYEDDDEVTAMLRAFLIKPHVTIVTTGKPLLFDCTDCGCRFETDWKSCERTHLEDDAADYPGIACPWCAGWCTTKPVGFVWTPHP